MRKPYQTLIIPYCKTHDTTVFLIGHRADLQVWQFISGGGEEHESPPQTAERELREETGLTPLTLIQLDSMTMIPKEVFRDHIHWPKDVLVIPEYAFAAEVTYQDITPSQEHLALKWVTYDEAMSLLRYDSNKTALWETKQRLTTSATH